MRWRRISLKLLHPSLWRSNGNAADAMFTVWAVSSSTSASVVWICAVVWVSPRQSQLHISYVCRPLPDKYWSLCIHWAAFFFFFLLIRATAPGTEFKAKPWSAASSPERRGQFCWRRDEPLMSSARSALDGGPSDGDGEHYWTAALWKYMRITEQRTLTLATQTALLTTQVAAWQQAGEEETGSTNSLPLFLCLQIWTAVIDCWVLTQ